MVIPIIESQEAVNNIEEILSVDGIDVVYFGPGDLSSDMGLDFLQDKDKLMDAWHKVRDCARNAGKPTLSPRGLGFDDTDILIAVMDWMVLLNAAKSIVSEHRTSR